MATACAAYPQDLFKKVKKALSIRGPSFIHLLAPCPPGWRYPPEKSVEIGKLAVKSGIWVLYERVFGHLEISSPSKVPLKNPIPLEDYLAPQGRFAGIDTKTVDILRQRIAKNLHRLAQEEAGIC
jgi:pyruvate ferredoxin oxidoreductase beta subunit